MVNLDWATVPGNSIEIVYCTGVTARNPSGSTRSIDTVKYRRAGTVEYYTELTYDVSNKVTLVKTFK